MNVFVKAERFCQIAIHNVGSLPERCIKNKKPLTKTHLLLMELMGYCRSSNCSKNCCCSAAAALVFDRPTSVSSPALSRVRICWGRQKTRETTINPIWPTPSASWKMSVCNAKRDTTESFAEEQKSRCNEKRKTPSSHISLKKDYLSATEPWKPRTLVFPHGWLNLYSSSK